MNTIFTLQILFLIIILFPPTPLLQAIETCPYFSCNHHQNDPIPAIQFPFRVPGNHTTRCGYPGFELSCNSNDQTLLNLSSSNSSNSPFIVQAINYPDQFLLLSDPDNCIPNRILNSEFDQTVLANSPYWMMDPGNVEYTFLNCTNLGGPTRLIPAGGSLISCLSGDSFTVVSTTEKWAEEFFLASEFKCEVIKRARVQIWWPEEGLYPDDMSYKFVVLNWNFPGCRDCDNRGGVCGFAADSGLSVGCFLSDGTANSGLPWSVKYGLILGVGIPGLLCMIGLTLFISGRVRAYNQNRNQLANRAITSSFSPAVFPQPIILTLGLDGPTIESYPKTILGESKRLPKPDGHGTCPICLSEYRPKEALRSIPECNHFFHAECIDEWLRLNGTCPLCRNSPQKS